MLDSRRNIALACALAGYVDGIGLLHLGGLFVSFMSGNSTRMGVSLAWGHWLGAIEALGLVALFVVGAAAGSLIVLGRGANRQPWVLLAEASLLAATRAGAGLRTCCCGRRWWRVPCAVRSPITGSISPRSGLPPLLRWR